ncbi:MAG: trigger factor [Dinghuibacter sp.]|nr:trigger factor [Dinghuibacter sp.]
MATVTRQTTGTLTEKISVSVHKEDYLPAFDKAIKNFSKNANIPGFRKGMVPVGMVKKMHGPAVFTDEVLKSVEKELFNYIEQEKLDFFAQPLPADENDVRNLDMNNPGTYEFAFEMGMKPDFSIAPLASANITRYKVTVTEEMIDNEVERLLQRFGKMTEPETVTTEDNALNVVFRECDAEGNETEGGITKDNSLLVKYFAPAFREQLMGKKKEDSFILQPNAAFEEKEREWVLSDLGLDKNDPEAGNRYFKLTITKVGLVEKRELNEEFFNEVYPNRAIATLDEFKAELKKEIEAYWDSQARNQIHDGIFHYLTDHTQMTLPEAFLKKWMQTGREKQITAEEAEQEYPSFSNSLKWTLISDRLVRDNNIMVTGDEIKEFARKQVMGYMGINALDESHAWLNDYAERMMKDKKYVEDSYHRISTEKLFHWAAEQVSTTEQPISMDEFVQLQQAHQHHH